MKPLGYVVGLVLLPLAVVIGIGGMLAGVGAAVRWPALILGVVGYVLAIVCEPEGA